MNKLCGQSECEEKNVDVLARVFGLSGQRRVVDLSSFCENIKPEKKKKKNK